MVEGCNTAFVECVVGVSDRSFDSVTAAHALVKAVKGERHELYARFAELVDGRPAMEPRDLLDLSPAEIGRAHV